MRRCETANMRIVEVSAGEVLSYRAKFSYDGARNPNQCRLPGDDHADSVHLLAFERGAAVGAATLTFDPVELVGGERVLWRLRALGVDQGYRRKGIGLALTTRRLWLAEQRGGVATWCSSRSENSDLFTRWGGELLGPFEVEGSQEPTGTTHMLFRWDVRLLEDRYREGQVPGVQ